MGFDGWGWLFYGLVFLDLLGMLGWVVLFAAASRGLGFSSG